MIDLRDPRIDPAAIRAALGLAPHPEGGSYRETWRDEPAVTGGRGAATAILFLLEAGEMSATHRVDATEFWLWQAGAPLSLRIGGGSETVRLGPHHGQGEVLSAVVPPFAWQSASTLGAWTLVSCVVAPAFVFSGFELAPSP